MARLNKNEANEKPQDSTEISSARRRYMSKAGEAVSRRKKQRKIAVIAGIIAIGGIAFLGILAFLGNVSSNFTVQVDPRPTDPTLRLTYDPNDVSESSTYIKSTGLSSAWTTSADDVIGWAKTFYDQTENGYYDEDGNPYLLHGNNILDNSDNPRFVNGEPVVNELALMYTFYLYNDFDGEMNYVQSFKIANYNSPSNNAQGPYNYLRVALFENDYTKSGEQTHNYKVYGLENTYSQTMYGFENGVSDYRECISNYTESKKVNETTGFESTYRNPTMNSVPENNDYCVPFLNSKGMVFSEQTSIKGYGRKRYTILIWLEGADPDCYGMTPKDCSLTFSMEFSNL